VTVDGTNVQELRGSALQTFRREKMGMVFQHFALFPHRNIIDNTGYGLKVQGAPKKERDAAALKALAMVGLEAYAQNAVGELSGGMQQRVGLARALCSDPPILLMDEAFSALDPLIRRQMQDELMIIQERLHKTILFITHDLNEALRIGNRVCILRDGYVVQIGTPEEILTEPANSYVAEFTQDVDQGRVIDVANVMQDAVVIEASDTLASAVDLLGERGGGFVVDDAGRPTGMLAVADAGSALAHGTSLLADVLRADFATTTATARLNEVYAAAGLGFPIAVLDDAGCLIGELEPREIMEEMGRVEQLIDGFEREVFL
jgi:glycine betaine/proline transport system ATP-binding protein